LQTIKGTREKFPLYSTTGRKFTAKGKRQKGCDSPRGKTLAVGGHRGVQEEKDAKLGGDRGEGGTCRHVKRQKEKKKGETKRFLQEGGRAEKN